jgi:pimeloyl-ACP methyl ester carboxylesterase
MTHTRFITAADGAPIAYDVTGTGPALMLLHGFTNSRQEIWHDFGWVERLSPICTVITVDLRGCGESGCFEDPARYGPELHYSDLHAIADACGVTDFMLWGFSWGATITRNMAAHSARVTRAVMAGSVFGDIFTESYLQPRLAHFEKLVRHKAEGRLDELPSAARAFAEQTYFPVYLARWHGLPAWPGVEPGDLRCPALVYTGTEDGSVVATLRQQRAAIEAAGIRLFIFDGLDHIGLVREVETVDPVVRAFLTE